MPKLKTHSGTKDRVRITKNGKVLRRRAGQSHNMQHKNASRKRTMAGPVQTGGRMAKSIKLNLGV
jgi:large subunit ribosomal protein L35